MTNPYLFHYQKKLHHPDLINADDEFGEDGWLATAGKFYRKKYRQGGGGLKGIYSMTVGTAGDLVDEIGDYSSTQKDSRRRNEGAWERKVEIAKAYKKLGPWPEKVPKVLYQVGNAYPDAPNWTWGLAMPPNTVADAYAQGAVAAYLTAKMWNRPQFIKLGDSLLAKAEHWGLKGKKPINSDSFLVSIQPTVLVVNSVSGLFQDKSGVDITKGAPVAKVMKGIVAKWLQLAYDQKIITRPTDIVGQIKNVVAGNDENQAKNFLKLLRNNAKPEEIKFSQKIASESQASVADVIYNMRGAFVLAGLLIAGVVFFPIIGPMLPSIGRGIGKVGKGVVKGVGAVGKGAGKLLVTGKEGAIAAYTQAAEAAEKGDVKEFVKQIEEAKSKSPNPVSTITQQQLNNLKSLAATNPQAKASPQEMKAVLRQVLAESQGQRI